MNGIDGYAEVSRHEARHTVVFNSWYPNGEGQYGIPFPASDVDKDYCIDVYEVQYGVEEGGPFDTQVLDSAGDGFVDGHDFVYWTAHDWSEKIGSADSQDWGNDGHQYDY